MKYYLSNFTFREPYTDLKHNKLMQKYLREIKKAGFTVTFEKDTYYEGYQHIVIDILDKEALVHLRKTVGMIVVHERSFDDEDYKYPKITIFGNSIISKLPEPYIFLNEEKSIDKPDKVGKEHEDEN